MPSLLNSPYTIEQLEQVRYTVIRRLQVNSRLHWPQIGDRKLVSALCHVLETVRIYHLCLCFDTGLQPVPHSRYGERAWKAPTSSKYIVQKDYKTGCDRHNICHRHGSFSKSQKSRNARQEPCSDRKSVV